MLAFYRSTVGKKIIMAVTGIIGIAFVILHMAGNLQAFGGAAKLNGYAAILHGPLAELILMQRVVLIAAVVLHVLMAWQLTARSRAARPVGYVRRETQIATFASRTMRWGGVLLLVFIVLHILHFTTNDFQPAGAFAAGDIYANVVGSFQIPWLTAFYVLAMVALGLHLYHGVWSSGRSLGVSPASRWPMRRRLALAIAVIVAAGFALVPLAAAFGLLR